MSAFADRFSRAVSYSEDMKTYHVRVNGTLLTDDDKDKLLARYEREMMKPVLGWYIEVSGENGRIVPVFNGDGQDVEFTSFTKAKEQLIKSLKDVADRYRAATIRARKLLKADVVAASVSDE